MRCIMDKQKLILEGLKQDSINEASLGRLFQHIGKDFIVFITSDRQVLDKSENSKRRKELEKYIRLAGFGYNKVVGSYKEEERQGILRKRTLLLSMVKMKKICSRCLNV